MNIFDGKLVEIATFHKKKWLLCLLPMKTRTVEDGTLWYKEWRGKLYIYDFQPR